MEYDFHDVEAKWQQYWRNHQTYKTTGDNNRPKYYVLDMFPYPSGAGLHVGHPLGYIASDIYSRYKRLKGFNVLHPMGYDAFGLPAEQYAIQTGQHPAITTEQNINRYREQLDKIGLSFDWSREVRTSDPSYYKWTQWIFMQLFNSWYNNGTKKAENIQALITLFQRNGNSGIDAVNNQEKEFDAVAWNNFNEREQQTILLNYRLAYLADTMVNWCPGLGTVLANEEVKDGVSERGGFPVERKLMKQWCLRITAYAERLLNDLDGIDWTESIKDAQRNWIGRSEGAMLEFSPDSYRGQKEDWRIEVFTTRPDTIFGVTFLTLAPEHELVDKITTNDQRKAIDEYVNYAKNRSERERMSEVKKISGAFTGAYAINPFNNEKIPVWIGDYVLSGYGTGAVMAVPAGDQRDWDFAKYFKLPIPAIVKDADISEGADATKDGIMINSGFLNGLTGHQAIKAAIKEIEKLGIGKGKINYRLRDAIFSRQRYWGEPFPVYYKEGLPYLVEESELPVLLPDVDKYLPTEDGEPPLARAKDWRYSPKSLNPGPSPSEKGVHPSEKGGVPVEKEEKKASWQTANVKNWEITKANSRELRKIATEAEDLLWQELRNQKLEIKFRRQHVIDEFIVDFVCLEKMLVIEVDGEIHNEQKEYDEQRTLILNENGFNVIRFTNKEVKENIQQVLHTIKVELQTRQSLTKEPSDLSEEIPPLRRRGVGGEAESYPYEHSTMPGWAGSSWYFLRYMDANNDQAFASKEAVDYWQDIDLYLGGAEHATGHLLYVRFWTKFLFDLGLIPKNEPAKKLINQGMIQGVSSFIFRVNGTNKYVSANLKSNYECTPLHVDVSMVKNNELNIAAIRKWRPEYADAEFILEDGKYICGSEVEKMSKSKWNVVSPDDIINAYGADCLRMYEMFLGPLEQSKPWNTNGISGVANFIRKLWRLYHTKEHQFFVSDEAPTPAELKVLHKTIKKVEEDVERFSFNTSVSTFMICINELTDVKCNKRAILEPLAIILSAYAPHVCEELWSLLGHKESISKAVFPKWNEAYLTEDSFEYPISINGKVRFKLQLSLNLTKEEVEQTVRKAEEMHKYLNGDQPKKVIVVPGRIVNIVV